MASTADAEHRAVKTICSNTVQAYTVMNPHKRRQTEPIIKKENNIGYVLCVEMASRKRQTYKYEDKNICTICV